MVLLEGTTCQRAVMHDDGKQVEILLQNCLADLLDLSLSCCVHATAFKTVD